MFRVQMSFGLEHLVCFHVALGEEQQGYHRAPKALAFEKHQDPYLGFGEYRTLRLEDLCFHKAPERGEGGVADDRDWS